MYKQYLNIQNTKYGKGTFTSVRIPADMPILEITGPIILDRELPENANMSLYLQIGPNTYLGPSGDVDDFINHHCDPNCKMHVVGNRAILYSLYVIPAGAEINFDYSTTDTSNDTMTCLCNSNKCRKIISGYNSLSNELQNKYKDKGMIPLYILEPTLIKKR